MITAVVRQQNLLLEQAIAAIVPVLGAYAGGTADGQPDVEAAIDRAAAAFAERIVSRWHDGIDNKPAHEVLQLLTELNSLTAGEARQQAAELLDQHLVDVRPADRSFALDYLAAIPAQVSQVLLRDRASGSGGGQLPPDWSLNTIEMLRRCLPVAAEMKLAWARSVPRPTDTAQLQTEPDSLRTALPVLNAPEPAPGLTLQHAAVVTKLRLLARCHRTARWAWWKRLFVLLLPLPICVALSIALGTAVYWLVYDNPQRQVRTYQRWESTGPFGNQLRVTDYYLRGKKVTQQEHDYYLATSSNEIAANIAAGGSGIGLFVLTFGGCLWFLGRHLGPIKVGLAEQIQAICEAHPEEVKNWGGPSVLHHRDLVEELLRIEDKGGQV
jgi:hypothetical protein